MLTRRHPYMHQNCIVVYYLCCLLQSLLFEHGKFPEKYRCMIWRLLLRLPDNAAAYEDLVRRFPELCSISSCLV
jgi:hypothetical protein